VASDHPVSCETYGRTSVTFHHNKPQLLPAQLTHNRRSISLTPAIISGKSLLNFQLPNSKSFSLSTCQERVLLIGINYTGSQNELRAVSRLENVAEFLSYRGYSTIACQVILRDDARGQYYQTVTTFRIPFSPFSLQLKAQTNDS